MRMCPSLFLGHINVFCLIINHESFKYISVVYLIGLFPPPDGWNHFVSQGLQEISPRVIFMDLYPRYTFQSKIRILVGASPGNAANDGRFSVSVVFLIFPYKTWQVKVWHFCYVPRI